MSSSGSRMFLMRAVLVLATLVLLPVERVSAGGVAPCEYPFAFEDAAVNAVILPFFYESGDAVDGAQLGEQLSALVQAEVLLSMLKYGSVGAIRLYDPNPSRCQPSVIISRLTQGTNGKVRPGNGLVLVWGRIYVEGEQIFLQTYVRFLRREAEDAIGVTLQGKDGASVNFKGRLPADAVATQPRAIRRQDLDAVRTAYRAKFVVRQKPADDAPGTPIDLHPGVPIAYAIVEVAGDWMRIESRGAGPSGWLRGRFDSKGWALREFLPELGFVDAVVGYERLNAEKAPHEVNVRKTYTWISEDLRAYEEAVGTNASHLALGVARTLQGFLLWNHAAAAGEQPARRQAAELFADAMQLIPQYAETRNLAAITEPYRATGSPPALNDESVRQLDEGLLGALAVDSHNATTLGNLDSLYAFALEHSGAAPLHPDLAQRLAVVRAAGKPQ